MSFMTDISPAATAARETARQPTGQFGTQEKSDPDITLAASVATAAWGEEFTRADAKVDALIPLVERRFRDLVRERYPNAATVNVGLSYDTDGDALLYISEVDGEEIDDDIELSNARDALAAYGFHHERLHKMSCEVDQFDHFTFDLNAIDGPAISHDEFSPAVTEAWADWDATAKLVPAIADETAARLGTDELAFRFADTDDDRRVTLHGSDGSEIEEPDLLGAMNAYVTAVGDLRLFPGVEQDEHDEWTFRYRVPA